MKKNGKTEEKKEKLKKFYLQGAKRIEKKHFSFAARNRIYAGMDMARARTGLTDSFIRKAADNGKIPAGISVAALGGYGRGDMCPFSDIDLLLLYKPGLEEIAEQVAVKIFYPIWDLKLDLGHSVRTVEQCADLCASDFVTMTSLFDCRFLFGDTEQYQALRKILTEELMPSCSARFIESKLTEAEERRKKFGSSVWMLEPNVKEAEGAIRDINTMLWISQAKYKIKTFEELLGKGIMTEKEFRITMKCMSFLLLLRSDLHYFAGKKQDRLSFDIQSEVAKFFGHRDSSTKAVERFMRIYYLRAGFVSEQFDKVVEKVSEGSWRPAQKSKTRHLGNGFTISGGALSVTGKNVLTENPANLVRAFEYADRYGVEISRYMRRLIRDQVPLIDEKTRNNPKFNRIFIGILKNGKNVYKTLSLMNRLRFLAHYIPEFGRIVCMMQQNAYHLYTVDVHSLFLVREVENLFKYKYEREFPLLTKVAETVVSRDILYLACLFHDMGKATQGDHEREGRKLTKKIIGRLGLARRDAEVLEFLVGNHQLMSDFSQRQDINDSELVSKFTRAVGDEERLSLLYMITFADLRSVGPGVWNNWKGVLLSKVYFSSLRIFESGSIDQTRSAAVRKDMVCREIARISEGKITGEEAAAMIETMPESYVFNHSPATMKRHLTLMKSSRGRNVMDVLHHEEEDCDEVTFWGKDRKSLFCTLCGVMSANGLNILGARAEKSSGGKVLDVLYVNKLGKSAADSPELWRKLEEDTEKALSGEIDLKAVLKKRTEFAFYGKTVPRNVPKISFDNVSSDKSTIVEILADDKPGLLYGVTNAMAETGLSINHAKVSTRAEQVFDVFYVTGRGGRKVKNPDTLEKVKEAILEAVNPKSAEG